MSYSNYWENIPEFLTYLCSLGNIDQIKEEDERRQVLRLREFVLRDIREMAEPGFEDFGNDMCRWLDWIKADDTTDPEEIARRYSAWQNRLSDDQKQAWYIITDSKGSKRDPSAKSRKIPHLHHRKPPKKP